MMNFDIFKKNFLYLALQGKLFSKNVSNEVSQNLLKDISVEKELLIKNKKMRRNNQEHIIFRKDNHYFEKIGENGEEHCIDEELPFTIPNHWEWCKLENITFSTPTKKFQIKQTEILENGKFPVVSQSKAFIEGFSNQTDKILHVSDPVIIFGDHTKNVKYVNFDFIVGADGVKILNPILIFPKFLYYLLIYGRLNIPDKGYNRHYKLLNQIYYPLPPIREQIKISNLLDLIEKYEKYNSELHALNKKFKNDFKKLTLEKSIRGKLVVQNPNDPPALVLLENMKKEKRRLIEEGKLKKDHEESTIYKENGHYYEIIGKKGESVCIDGEIPFDIPDSWEFARIKTVCQINPRNNLDDDVDVSFVPMENIEESYSNSFSYDIRKWGKVKKGYTHFAKNDIGVAKITPCFENRKSVIFDNLKNDFGAGTTELHILRPFSNMFNLDYLLFYCKSDYFIENGINHFTGTAGQKRFGRKYLENFLIPIPPLNEQKRIVDKINLLFDNIDNLLLEE